MSKKYLFYITQNYSFEILRPLQTAIYNRGDDCAWFATGDAVNRDYFEEDEIQINSVEEAKEYNPTAVFVPGNVVPNFIPGYKVQVAHGLEYKKRGFFRIRDFFDLYCTQGNITTNAFNRLAQKHQNFHVVETGWSKLDPLFDTKSFVIDTDLPVVLFAPTFSPSLTCALECYEAIKQIVEKGHYYWLVKFHPKMNPEWVQMYRELESDTFRIVETDSCIPLLRTADVMLSDTSSIIGEFLLLIKPVVSYKNAKPGKYLVNINSPEKIENGINYALSRPAEVLNPIYAFCRELHPYKDGMSSNRILEAVDKLESGELGKLKKRPMNLFRNLKLRKQLGYWGI